MERDYSELIDDYWGLKEDFITWAGTGERRDKILKQLRRPFEGDKWLRHELAKDVHAWYETLEDVKTPKLSKLRRAAKHWLQFYRRESASVLASTYDAPEPEEY